MLSIFVCDFILLTVDLSAAITGTTSVIGAGILLLQGHSQPGRKRLVTL